MRLLAAAFPRAAWKAESDAAYTIALVDAGVSADEVSAAVRQLVRTEEQLPTIATIIEAVRQMRHDERAAAWRCPACGSDKVAVTDATVRLCFDCDWQPDGGTT